jgi:hypothetical protein
MSIKVRFERVSLPIEWLVISDRTKAADFTKLWNDAHKSISFVKGLNHRPGRGTFAHIVGNYDAGHYE